MKILKLPKIKRTESLFKKLLQNAVLNNGLLQWRGSGISEMAQVVILKFLAIFVMAWSWLVATESKPPDVKHNIFFAEQKPRIAQRDARSFLKILQSVVVFVWASEAGKEIENPETSEDQTNRKSF